MLSRYPLQYNLKCYPHHNHDYPLVTKIILLVISFSSSIPNYPLHNQSYPVVVKTIVDAFAIRPVLVLSSVELRGRSCPMRLVIKSTSLQLPLRRSLEVRILVCRSMCTEPW